MRFTLLLMMAAAAAGQTPDVQRQLDAVASAATTMVDGDVCQRIVTARARQFMFAQSAQDRFAAGDNYDVDDQAFNQTKKTLMRLARLTPFPCDVNLWMPIAGHPDKVRVVVRNVHELSQFWTFGALYQDMFPPMKRVLDTGEHVTVREKPGMISVLAPVYNSLGEIAGLVEVASRAAAGGAQRTASPEPAASLDRLIGAVRGEVRPDQAMEFMRRVYSTDRWFTFPKFQETAAYLKRTMSEIGLEQVEIVAAPADGVSQFGFWTMPLAWDARSARLELLGADVPAEFRVLADYEKVPSSLGMWSGPTPPGGITAEVVEVKDLENTDVRGKLVLTSRNPADAKWLLAKKGALGAINAFTENPELQNDRQWINAWGDNGWAFTKGSAPLLCFSITPRQAAYVRKLLASGRRVEVKATVDTRYYSGTYPYTTGVIPGTGNEEVLTLGHTSEQGAQDNATGVAGMLESVATLNRLIAAGKLARPRRSIRILLAGEMYGSLHYVASNPERIRRTVAAMCVDTPAASYKLAGTEYTFYLNPHVAKSYTDAFVLRVARQYLAGVARPWHWKEQMPGTDSYLGEPTVGIPTVWPYSGSGIHTHHNSADKPEDADPHSLRDLAVMNAAYLYYLASAGEPEAKWLAELALERGYEQVLASAAGFLDRIYAARLEQRPELLYQGLEKVDYEVAREKQSIMGVERLDGRNLAPLVERLERFGREQSERLRAAAGVAPQAPAADPQLSAAEKIVVRRKRFGTIPLDEIRPDQREGFPSGAWSATPITALYWCDGKRTLAEAMRLTRLELGPVKFDFVGYFRFLRRRGYVDFVAGE